MRTGRLCESRPVGAYAALRCERQFRHSGQHVAWNGEDSDVRWGSNSPKAKTLVDERLTDSLKAQLDGNGERCPARRGLGSGGQCVLLEGHEGEHRYAERVIGV
jgi:hypothetical protein